MTLFLVEINFIDTKEEKVSDTYIGGVYTSKEKAIKAIEKWSEANERKLSLVINNDAFLIRYKSKVMFPEGDLQINIIKTDINKEISDEF